MPLWNRARTIPSDSLSANPFSHRLINLAVKSVSLAVVAAYSVTLMGPQTSVSAVTGLLMYTSTSSGISP